jgi:hypothetical protein
MVATTLGSLGLASVAAADQPTREVIPVSTDEIFTGWCSFPVHLQETGTVIVQTFTGHANGVTKESDIAVNYRGTLTNQDTGAHLSLAYPGGLHITYYADGSHTTRGTGPTIITPPLPSPATGAVGLWLVRGQFRYEVDPDGTITSSDLNGTQVDLCAELAQ